jgi:hypothetical protein
MGDVDTETTVVYIVIYSTETGARQSKDVNRIVKIGYGQLFLRDEP